MQSLFAVFDGHGGDYTARFLESRFADMFGSLLRTKQAAQFAQRHFTGEGDTLSIDAKSIESCLRDTCLKLNEELAQDPRMMSRSSAKKTTPTKTAEGNDNTKEERTIKNATGSSRGDGDGDDELYTQTKAEGGASSASSQPMDGSGACGVIVVATTTHLVVCHVGDCRAVLLRGGVGNSSAELLTSDHTCAREDEKSRVEESGGHVHPKTLRIGLTTKFNDTREPSRSWGDFMFCNAGVVCLPEMKVMEREPEGMELLVLGCDGIFEGRGMDASEVVRVLVEEADCVRRAQSQNISSTTTTTTTTITTEGSKETKGTATTTVDSESPAAPSTPQSGMSHAALTEEVVCRQLQAACEAVMLRGLDQGCRDNQTLCVALLRPSVFKSV